MFKGVQSRALPGTQNQVLLESLRDEAAVLREVRGRLLEFLEANCVELQGYKADTSPVALFSVGQIDSYYLRRAALRAVRELTIGLFEREIAFDSSSEQFRAVQARLSECYHVEVLARLVEDHVGMVLGTLALSPEYKKLCELLRATTLSAEKDHEDAIVDDALRSLWKLCVGSLHALLDTAPAAPLVFKSRLDVPLVEPDEVRNKREQENQAKLKSLLEKRSKVICAALVGTKPEDEQQRKAWCSAGTHDANKRTILQGLEEYLHQLIFDSATDLKAMTAATQNGQQNNTLQWAETLAYIGDRLAILDSNLFPLERASGQACWSNLELVQISARDVRNGLSNREAKDKLSGDEWGNLSGFLKASWRVNDLMWGRLDGSGAILDSLLDYERLSKVVKPKGKEADPAVVREIMKAIEDYILYGFVCGNQGAQDDIGELLQNEWTANKQVIEDWFTNGLPANPLASQFSSEFVLLKELLLRRHQLEILRDEVPEVVATIIAEHAEWQGAGSSKSLKSLKKIIAPDAAPTASAVIAENTDRLAQLFSSHPTESVRKSLYQQARFWAGAIFGEDEKNNIKPKITKIVKYFDDNYKVGAESVNDIPAPVTMQRLVALALLNLRAFEHSIPEKIRNNSMGTTIGKVLRVPTFLLNLLYGVLSALTQGTTFVTGLLVFLATIEVTGLLLLVTLMNDDARGEL